MKKSKKYLHRIIITLSLFYALMILLYSQNEKLFNHYTHNDSAIYCKDCHTKIENSKKASDNNYPDLKFCLIECHSKKDIENTKLVNSSPKLKIEFNHSSHLKFDYTLKCPKCHGKVISKNFQPGTSFPPMSTCYECHDNTTAKKNCTLCHIEKVTFPHITHRKKGIPCKDCHNSIEESTKVDGGKDIPKEKVCEKCHDKKDGYVDIVKRQYKQLYKMNHKVHFDKKGLTCKDCHKVIYDKAIFDLSETFPKMAYCFKCHDNTTAPKKCSVCHFDLSMYEGHSKGWDKLHKIKANFNMSECLDCHNSGSFCKKCHNAIIRPINNHSSNYIITHKYDVRVRIRNCRSCHSRRQCLNCHKARKISGSSISLFRHPSGWLTPGSPNFHKRSARIRLSSCTTCHTKNDCIFCHSTKRR